MNPITQNDSGITNPSGTGNLPIANPNNQAITQPTTTFDASALSTPSSSTQIPSPLTTVSGPSNNLSIPSPTIPSAEDIINKGASQTPAEATQQTLLQKIAGLVGSNKTQTTLTNEAETNAGVPTLTKTLNDLNTQLQGLNDQSTALGNEAQYTIPNSDQLGAEGKGITAGGLAPKTASELRMNQIKQGAIATQSLTLKSAIYGAQGQLTLAKDAADKAATAQYEQEQQQIDAAKAQLDAIAPTLNKEEKAQAAIQQSQLADRQTKIDNAKADKTTIIAMATAALKNNPNDPQAQYAAQQALQESNQQVPDLQKAFALVGKYQTDPVAAQQALAQLAFTRSTTAKNYADIAKLKADSIDTNNATVAGWVTNIKNGTAKLSDVPSGMKNAVSTGLSQGTSAPSTILATTKASLQELNDMVSSNHGFTAAIGTNVPNPLGIFTDPIDQIGFTGLPGSQSADFIAKMNQVKNDVVLPNLTLLHGLGRVTDREFQALSSSLTSLNTHLTEGAFKTELKNITDRINAIPNTPSNDTSTDSTKTGTLSDGTVVTQNADGSITDAKGNKYDQNGNKIN